MALAIGLEPMAPRWLTLHPSPLYCAGLKPRLEAGVHHAVLPVGERNCGAGEPGTERQCIHRQRLDSIQPATPAIGDRISFYNSHRQHRALDMKSPAAAFALDA